MEKNGARNLAKEIMFHLLHSSLSNVAVITLFTNKDTNTDTAHLFHKVHRMK